MGPVCTLRSGMLSVRDLLSIPSLSLSVAAGARGLDNVIRFAHTSELSDPTPWLSGGELLLTTGMGLRGSAASQRSYVERLARARLAGLGLGLGFGFSAAPPPVRATADEYGWPVLEVPYPVPFIAITEAVAARLAADRLREAQMSVELHDRLSAMITEEGAGPADVLDELTSLASGWALLFDLTGSVLAQAAAEHVASPEPGSVWERLPRRLLRPSGPATASDATPQGIRLALAVHVAGRPQAALVFGKDRRLEQRDRIVVRHAATVLGLLLSARRAVIEVERRIGEDILNEAFSGRLAGADLQRRLEPLGFGPASRPSVVVVEPRGELGGAITDLSWIVDSALGARCAAVRTAEIGHRIAAVVLHEDPSALARSLCAELATGMTSRDGTAVRVGFGTTVAPTLVRDSYLAGLFALRAAPPGKDVVGPADLGSYRFFLGAQTRPALEGYIGSVLGPLIDRDERRSSELVDSVRAFIGSGGRWEQGAERLGVHRHTLRYRVRQAEELLGRDLATAEDRMEVWLALKALDVLNA
jgi:purine catabolism regulator